MRRTTAQPATRSPQPTAAAPRSTVPRAATARRAAGPEQAEYAGSMSDLAPIPEASAKNAVAASHLGSNSPDVVASAVDESAALESPPVRKFRVEVEKNISHNGIRSILRQGKEIDENNYDIAALQKQGVKLTEIQPEG